MDTIENLYGIDIDYYAKINFTSMEDLMDVIGPVTVYSEDEFWSWNYPEEHYVVGDNKLDTSRRALGFLRERYGLVGGDFSRGRNHMVFLKAVFKKIMSPSIIVNYLDLIKVVDKAVLSDIPTSLLTSLAKEQIDKNYSWDIESMAPSGTPQYAYSYQIGGEVSVTLLDEDDVAEVSEKIISFMNKR
jgi:anionic cell wall polymer biosynthesis LytR-Cps2A-Psr (LCP) family protein